MTDERREYTVLRAVQHPLVARTAYLPGEGIQAQVVEDLGLIVGEDVTPARSDVIPMPAGNASRGDWERYAQFQAVDAGHPTQDEIDGMTRDQLRDLYSPPAKEAKPDRATKSTPVKGD
jgi:hypothetical protein